MTTGQPPPIKRKGSPDWTVAASLLAASPNMWVKVLDGVSTGMIQKAREGRIPQFSALGGSIDVVQRKSYFEPDHPNTRRGEMYAKWTPSTK